MVPGYLKAIELAGGVPVILPLSSDKSLINRICRTVDGLLFTGGQDVFPGLYGEETVEACGPICTERDDMETLLFTEAILGMDIPALGICRGLQLFNVMLGGALYQDIPLQFKRRVQIEHQQKSPSSTPSHDVLIDITGPLHSLFRTETIAVNSSHHQGIRKLSPMLKCMAVAGDGLIEGVYMPEKRFVWAVQWHPELTLDDRYSCRLFEALVQAGRANRRQTDR